MQKPETNDSHLHGLPPAERAYSLAKDTQAMGDTLFKVFARVPYVTPETLEKMNKIIETMRKAQIDAKKRVERLLRLVPENIPETTTRNDID